MMNEPLVSVVIPTYNRSEMLMQTLKSVIDQTYPAVEAIVVDDCSKDDTAERVAELSEDHPNVRYHRQDQNRGGNAARNKGLELSNGELVSFLDSDDLFRPEKVRRQVEALEACPEADACVCQIAVFQKAPGDSTQAWNRLEGEHPLLRYAANDVVWGTAAPLWKRSALEHVGPWDESLPYHQDLDYHLRALVLGVKFVVIPDVLEDYRDEHSSQITAGSKRRKEGLRVQLDIYERAEGIARERGILDERLGTAFATTYVWCAIVAARMREWPQIWRAMAAAKRVDPSARRQAALRPLLGITTPMVYALGTGAKPLVDLMSKFDLPYHRWHFTHSLAEVAGKTYTGKMEYP